MFIIGQSELRGGMLHHVCRECIVLQVVVLQVVVTQ
jgi:hypothetical protein